jgi:DNA end-binding protein Ku
MASTVWRGYISFALISIPVRLFRAARAERISLRKLYRAADQRGPVSAPEPASPAEPVSVSTPEPATRNPPRELPVLGPVQQASVLSGSDRALPQTSIVKGYEYEKDRFVAIEPEELKSAAIKTSTAMEIQEFVPLAEIDPVYFETSYYVVPEEAGEKAYALLYRSLQLTGLVAVAEFAMHGREHVVILRPGKKGVLAHTMFFSSEVRADEEFPADPDIVTKKELDLAQTLIHSLAGRFEPEKYRDAYREKLQSLIDEKVKGRPARKPLQTPQPARVVDIAEALRQSLATLKKPASSAGKARAKAKSQRES